MMWNCLHHPSASLISSAASKGEIFLNFVDGHCKMLLGCAGVYDSRTWEFHRSPIYYCVKHPSLLPFSRPHAPNLHFSGYAIRHTIVAMPRFNDDQNWLLEAYCVNIAFDDALLFQQNHAMFDLNSKNLVSISSIQHSILLSKRTVQLLLGYLTSFIAAAGLD